MDSDLINTGAGNDTVTLNTRAASAFTAASVASVIGGAGVDDVNGSAVGFGRALFINGAGGNDVLRGSSVADTLNGGSGDDNLTGEAGDDILIGGDGNDVINGGKGNDTLTGGAGADRFLLTVGGVGSTNVVSITDFGTGGNDELAVDASVTANVTMTELFGNTYTAPAAANAGITNITMAAGVGAGTANFANITGNGITINANSNNINYVGSVGANTFVGGAGNDTFTGGAGADVVNAGAGTNSIVGGVGADTVTINTAGATTTVSAGAATNEIRVLGTNGAVNLRTSLATTIGTYNLLGTTQDVTVLNGAAADSSVVITNANDINITASALTGALTATVVNAVAKTVAPGTTGASIINKTGVGTLTVNGAAMTTGTLNLNGTSSLAGDIDVTNYASTGALTLNNLLDIGAFSVTTAGATARQLVLGTSTTVTSRTVNASSIADDAALTLTGEAGNQAVTVTTANADVVAATYAGAVTATVTNDNGNTSIFEIGTAATGITKAGSGILTIDADAGGVAAGALTVSGGGTGNITVNDAENTVTLADTFAGSGLVTVGVSNVNAVTVALGTSTTGTRTVNTAQAATRVLTLTGSDAATVGLALANLTAGAYVGDLAVTADAAGGATANTINTGSGNDTITGGDGADVINAGAGNNVLRDMNQGTAIDVVVNNAGATMTATITGDAVTSAATINNAANTAFVINVAGANTMDLTAAGTVNGYTVLSTGTGAVTGSAQADILTNTSGNATFTGLAGLDTFTATANQMTIADLGVGNVNDVLIATGAAVVVATVTGNYVAGASNSNTSSGAVGLTGDFNMNMSAAGGTAGYSLTGGAGNQTLIGSGFADIITGGADSDALTGGAGANRFVYTTVTDSNANTAFDTITNITFNGAAGDRIDITATGTLTAALAVSGAANLAAADTVAELTGLFNTTNGTAGAGNRFTGGGNATALLTTNTDGSRGLVVDVDGNGVYTAADIFVNLTNPTATSFNAAVFV